jgi:hypothetical protein
MPLSRCQAEKGVGGHSGCSWKAYATICANKGTNSSVLIKSLHAIKICYHKSLTASIHGVRWITPHPKLNCYGI